MIHLAGHLLWSESWKRNLEDKKKKHNDYYLIPIVFESMSFIYSVFVHI